MLCLWSEIANNKYGTPVTVCLFFGVTGLKGDSAIFKLGPYVCIFGCVNDLYLQQALELKMITESVFFPMQNIAVIAHLD